MIERTDIKGNYKVKSDKKGHYLYAGLPMGTFKVSVEIDGQVKDMVQGVRTNPSDSTVVNFDLKARAEQGATPGQAAPAEVERGMSDKQKAEYEKKLGEQKQQMAKNRALNDAFNAGREAMDAKNYQAATEAFSKASELDATQHVVWANMADAYTALAKTKTGADQQADLDKAIAAYQKAIEIKADDPAYLNNYAIALALDKKLEDAQTQLTKAAQLDPPDAGKYYYNLGAVLVNTNQMDAAGAAFKKAIETTPNYADAHYQYGIYLLGKATTTSAGKTCHRRGPLRNSRNTWSSIPTAISLPNQRR